MIYNPSSTFVEYVSIIYQDPENIAFWLMNPLPRSYAKEIVQRQTSGHMNEHDWKFQRIRTIGRLTNRGTIKSVIHLWWSVDRQHFHIVVVGKRGTQDFVGGRPGVLKVSLDRVNVLFPCTEYLGLLVVNEEWYWRAWNLPQLSPPELPLMAKYCTVVNNY